MPDKNPLAEGLASSAYGTASLWWLMVLPLVARLRLWLLKKEGVPVHMGMCMHACVCLRAPLEGTRPLMLCDPWCGQASFESGSARQPCARHVFPQSHVRLLVVTPCICVWHMPLLVVTRCICVLGRPGSPTGRPANRGRPKAKCLTGGERTHMLKRGRPHPHVRMPTSEVRPPYPRPLHSQEGRSGSFSRVHSAAGCCPAKAALCVGCSRAAHASA